MKIKQITYQYRRDFEAVYECESCGAEQRAGGYDDRNYHDNVIPKMKCPKCDKSRIDLGIVGEFIPTRYPEGYQI
ncbi:MAG: hypothetical protein HGA27_00385 [Peptococcaceae bacterium]|nr:hypothetical protein [Peptococcaceae bacterium]